MFPQEHSRANARRVRPGQANTVQFPMFPSEHFSNYADRYLCSCRNIRSETQAMFPREHCGTFPWKTRPCTFYCNKLKQIALALKSVVAFSHQSKLFFACSGILLTI